MTDLSPSTPLRRIFVLIVLTTLLIGAITVGAIGLLYTVGAAPLPSVLTAGGVPGKKE
jgi:predicted membrane metal-binding protein